MKKVIFLSFVLLVLGCNQSFARQSVFNGLDNTVLLECLRLKQSGQIGNECYGVGMQLEADGYLYVTSVSPPTSLSYEDSDSILELETSEVIIPQINVGLEVYSVSLAYDAANSRLSINSLTPLQTQNSGTETTGTCTFEGQSSWYTAALTETGFSVCIAYDANISVSSASQACTSLGGLWNANSACPANYLNSCANTDTINNISFTNYYYDAGAVERYNADVSLFELMGYPASFIDSVPSPAEQLFEACVNDGGVPF